MTIYIANTTRQEFEIQCRLPEMGRIWSQRISSGKQIEVKNMSGVQEQYLIAHMQRFGALKRAELHGKITGFQGLAFDTAKPFQMNEFHYGFDEVLDGAESRSVVEATRSALAAAQSMKDKNTNEMMSMSSEIEIVEEHPDKKDKRSRKMKITVDPSISSGDSLPMH